MLMEGRGHTKDMYVCVPSSHSYKAIMFLSTAVAPNASVFVEELVALKLLNTRLRDTVAQVPDRATMIQELEQRKLRNTKASVAFGSAKVLLHV